MVWILAEKSPGQLIGLCNIYLHESFGFRLMCGWYNRCSGGHFAFCPVAAETFCGRKKRHVVCLIWLIAPYADSPIGDGLSLLPVPQSEADVIYSNHQRPSWEKDLTLQNQLFMSSIATTSRMFPKAKSQIFILIVGSQFFTQSKCKSLFLLCNLLPLSSFTSVRKARYHKGVIS